MTRLPHRLIAGALALLGCFGCSDESERPSGPFDDMEAGDAGAFDDEVDSVAADVGYVEALAPLWAVSGAACTGCHFLRTQTFTGELDEQALRTLVDKGPRDGLRPSTVGGDDVPCADRKYIVPGKPEESYLIDKLLGHPQIAGNCFAGERMRPSCEPSSECITPEQIAKLAAWIRAGARFP